MSTRAIVTAPPSIQPDLCTHAPASTPLSIAALRTPSLQRKCACNGGSCKSCEEDKERKLQRAGVPGAPQPSTIPPVVHEVLRSTGSPLDAPSRAFFEPRFGHDFSRVRVHATPRAAQSADAVGALAYTVGSDVVFAAGQFAPHSPSGRHLLAHELTHVVQQSGTPASLPNSMSGSSDDTFEREADHIADRITEDIPGSARTPAHSTTGLRIQRKPAASNGGPAKASRGPAVVEDGLPTAPGQMNRSAFLTTLRDTLIRSADAELRPFNRTAQGCPYILRTIERYAARPIASLMRVLQAFAHPPATADAPTIIDAVTQKARIVARNLGQKYGDRLQSMTDSPGASVPAHDPAAVRSQLGAGQPLDSSPRGAMETSFGHDFSSVRIHADPTAARLNNQLRARAFTIGQHIAFSDGAYQPGTRDGDTLLAHELAHTVQQRSALPGASGPTSEQHLERQAERAASAALSSGTGSKQPDDAPDLSSSDLRIQRWPAIVAGAIITAEAAPEAIVIAEVATVSTEVVVVDSAIVATAEVAVPTAVETLAPAAIETVAPAAIESVAPAAIQSTTAAASTAASTTATAIGVGVAATTLSSDSPEEQQSCQFPTGLTPLDPIPITWFKVWTPDYYPPFIEIGGHTYDRDNPAQQLPHGEPIGVSASYRPYRGKIVQLDPMERGPNADRFRAVTGRYGFDWAGLQADHVQDLQWSGDDDFNNLWPLDASANLSAGPRQNDFQVVTFCETARGPQRTLSLRQMKAAAGPTSQYYGRWFVISNFSR